jgi:hypothetical protein
MLIDDEETDGVSWLLGCISGAQLNVMFAINIGT